MSRSRKFGAYLLIMLLLLILGPSASAASDKTTSKIVREKVEWTLSPDQCSDIKVHIKGTGQRLQVITTIMKPDDKDALDADDHTAYSKEIIDNDFVTGTAVDAKGGTYDFIYTNQARQLVPDDGGRIKVYMTDTFELNGNKGANNLHVSFVWRWTYTPPEEIFPPVHNWKKVHTFGDPLTCDPI